MTKASFACTFAGCDKVYARHQGLKNHVAMKHSDRSALRFPCTLEGCSQRFIDQRTLDGHIQKCENTPVVMRKVTKSRTEVKRMTENERKEYDKEHARAKSALHRKPADCTDRVICKHCGQNCARSALHDHVKKMHGGENGGRFIFSCPECKETFSSKQGRDSHLASIHYIGSIKTCPYCPRQMGDASNFHRHLQMHRGEKPYKCSQCDYASVQKTSLDKHLFAIHSTEGRQREKRSEERCNKMLNAVGYNFSRNVYVNLNGALKGDTKRCAYIDFVVSQPQATFFVENDEDQHKAYNISCDIRRMMDIQSALQMSDQVDGPVVWVRYNPDGYSVDNEKMKISSEDRQALLKQLLDNYVPANPVEIIYMFYDAETNTVTQTLEPAIFADPDYNDAMKELVTGCITQN